MLRSRPEARQASAAGNRESLWTVTDKVVQLEGLFPPGVITDSALEGTVEGNLCPEEEVSLRRAVATRKAEFCCGRFLARRALRKLGVSAGPLPVGRARAPVWPGEVVGSISHSHGLCGVAVARGVDFLGLGLDMELGVPLDADLASEVCTPRELSWIEKAPPAPAADWPMVFFSAKESVYKCLHPLTGVFLEFHDVEVAFQPEVETFTAALSVMVHGATAAYGAHFSAIRGRFAFREGYVLAGANMARGE